MHILFVKSFSKGQITIPKSIRDQFGIADEFWLKLSVEGRRIIAEPITEEKKLDREAWKKKLLQIKGTWNLEPEIRRMREETEKRLQKNAL